MTSLDRRPCSLAKPSQSQATASKYSAVLIGRIDSRLNCLACATHAPITCAHDMVRQPNCPIFIRENVENLGKNPTNFYLLRYPLNIIYSRWQPKRRVRRKRQWSKSSSLMKYKLCSFSAWMRQRRLKAGWLQLGLAVPGLRSWHG